MVLYLIGLGLGDVEDITVKGLNTVKRCAKVYLEAYTSMLCYGLDKTQLEVFYGRPLIEADRQFVEERCGLFVIYTYKVTILQLPTIFPPKILYMAALAKTVNYVKMK